MLVPIASTTICIIIIYFETIMLLAEGNSSLPYHTSFYLTLYLILSYHTSFLSYHTTFLSYHISYLSQDSPKGLCGSSKMPVAPVTIATREGQESVSLSLFPVRNQTDFLSQGIALVCLNYRTPMYVQCLSVLVCYLSKV